MRTSTVSTAVPRSIPSPTSNKAAAAPLRTNHPAETAVSQSADGDSSSFSADQIDTRANATTEVLNQIMDYTAAGRDFRYWGINE